MKSFCDRCQRTSSHIDIYSLHLTSAASSDDGKKHSLMDGEWRGNKTMFRFLTRGIDLCGDCILSFFLTSPNQGDGMDHTEGTVRPEDQDRESH